MKVYALYVGDRSISDWTIYQITEMTGIKRATLKWYGTTCEKLNGNKALVKIDEDDDMFVGSNQPRSKRSHSVYAPTLTNDEDERTEDVKVTHRRMEIKPFKFESRWINYQLDGMFRGW